jgi:hypothetical protein
MASYGQASVGTYGTSLAVSADGRPEMKAGGVTIDWGTVTAVTADTTWLDGVVVPNGSKGLRYGQVICQTGVAEVQTYTWTGGPTAGSAVLTFAATPNFAAETLPALAFNATAADVLAALEGLARVGPGGVTVARTGTGINADPYVYTATFNRGLGDVTQPTATHTFTGGTTPTATIATTTAGTGGGKYGPYDPSATDGRQTLTRGQCFVLNRSVRQNEDRGSDHPPALYGGLVFKQRILATPGTASLAAGPTIANLETAFPRLAYVAETPA